MKATTVNLRGAVAAVQYPSNGICGGFHLEEVKDDAQAIGLV